MKNKCLICLALSALLLAGCAPAAPVDDSFDEGEVSSTPELTQNNLTFDVRADWSRLEGERTAHRQPDVDGGRWYPEFTDRLIPGEDYGPLIPYLGSLVYPYQRWENPTGEMQEYWYEVDAFYGLMTREGKIVVDPVYQSADSYSYRWQGEELALPVLILHRSDPVWAETDEERYAELYSRYAVAAENGRWATDFEFLRYTNRGDQLLLAGPQGLTQLDSVTGSQKNWTWEDLGVREEEVSTTLNQIRWIYGLTWTEHGVLVGTAREETGDSSASSCFRIFQPENGEISWVDEAQWEAWYHEHYDRERGQDWELIQEGNQVTLSFNGESCVISDAPSGCWSAKVRNGLAILRAGSGYQLRRLSDGELLLEGVSIEFIQDSVHPERLGCVSVRGNADHTVYDADLNPILSLPRTGDGWLGFALRDGLLSYYDGNSRFGCWDLNAGRYIFYRNFYLGD